MKRFMKLKPKLVRGYVGLAAEIFRLAYWVLMVASLTTNYRQTVAESYAEL